MAASIGQFGSSYNRFYIIHVPNCWWNHFGWAISSLQYQTWTLLRCSPIWVVMISILQYPFLEQSMYRIFSYFSTFMLRIVGIISYVTTAVPSRTITSLFPSSHCRVILALESHRQIPLFPTTLRPLIQISTAKKLLGGREKTSAFTELLVVIVGSVESASLRWILLYFHHSVSRYPPHLSLEGSNRVLVSHPRTNPETGSLGPIEASLPTWVTPVAFKKIYRNTLLASYSLV